MSTRWKAHELETAKALGTTRNPSNGRRQNDIDAGPWAIEHKSRRTPWRFLRDAMRQAAVGALTHGSQQTPIVVLYDGVGHERRRWVIMQFEDFEQWHGRTMTDRRQCENRSEGRDGRTSEALRLVWQHDPA